MYFDFPFLLLLVEEYNWCDFLIFILFLAYKFLLYG